MLAPLLGLAASAAAPPTVPALVFVSRRAPAAGERGAIPGLGPHQRTLATGGRLLVREPDGRIRPLLRAGALFDVSDPCVSWDGRRVAFAGAVGRDSTWRIYVVGADGRGLAALTRTDRVLDLSPLGGDPRRFERYDDFDPCWLPDGRVCFASTRFPQVAEEGDVLASNLFTMNADGTGLRRLTSERNGAEEPAVDPATGRIVYARWWFNRYLASEIEPFGVTTDRACAVPSDTVDLWHAVSVQTDGDGIRLAGGDPRGRASVAAHQPVLLRDGTLIGVRPANLSLLPSAGGAAVQVFPGGFAAPRLLAGLGVRARSACSPAALPDGRLVLSLDLEGRGDFGLYLIGQRGERLTRLVDLPGTLELDAAPLVARARPPVLAPPHTEALPDLPFTRCDQLSGTVATFRFDCLNVFANSAVDRPFPEAPPMQRGVRIRFYGTLARPAVAGGDTVVLVREARVTPAGAVHEEDLPADTPMFEQLVDERGRVLRSASGPAHVPGFNFARYGSGTKCVGCHAGHSALPVPQSAGEAKWVNATPSAEVSASSEAPGTAGAAAIADLKTAGPAAQVAWVALSAVGEKLQLRWRWPIEVSTLVLYAIRPDRAEGTELRIEACELVFFRNGREVVRSVLLEPLSPAGTRANCNGVRVDAIEIRPIRVSGLVAHRRAAGLAEIETIARLVED